jgi:hypothetical protein
LAPQPLQQPQQQPLLLPCLPLLLLPSLPPLPCPARPGPARPPPTARRPPPQMLLAGWGRIGVEVQQADNLYKLCSSGREATGSGSYFVGGRPSQAAGGAHDAAVQRRLWQLLQEQSGAAWPGWLGVE